MGFIGSSSARELDAQTDLPDPDPIDEIDYELEIELAAEECELESSFEDDAPDQPDAIPANNTSDLFEYFFREQARLAFLSRGNQAYNNNDVSPSNDSWPVYRRLFVFVSHFHAGHVREITIYLRQSIYVGSDMHCLIR